MKKSNIYKILYAISILLIIIFVALVGYDYFYYYTDYFGAAPFYVFILFRTVTFIIPSIIVFIIARVLRKKYNQ